jgi:hypothetical protein
MAILANFKNSRKKNNNNNALMIHYIHVLKGINNDWICDIRCKG